MLSYMTQTSPRETCSEPGCAKPAGPKMNRPICWAHYQRNRRGSTTEASVRDYGTGQKGINMPALAPQVLEMMLRAIAASAPDSRPTIYEATRRIMVEWLRRASTAGTLEGAYLMGRKAIDEPVLSEVGYKKSSKFHLQPAELAELDRAVKATGWTTYTLTRTVFDDWFYYWLEHDVAPEGGTTISPYGLPGTVGRPAPRKRKRRGG